MPGLYDPGARHALVVRAWITGCLGRDKERVMVRIVGIDHLVIRVGDFAKSKAF